MDKWKKIFRKLLFPRTIIVFLLFNVSLFLLLYVFLVKERPEALAYFTYLLSSYGLTVVCVRFPEISKDIKERLYSNKYSGKYLTEKELRIRISLYGGLGLNICFAIFKVVMGVMFHSRWLFAMAGYNVVLSSMRFVLVYRDQTNKNKETDYERKLWGVHSYKVCGWLMLLLNIAISVIVFMVVFENQTIVYPGFMIYAIATFTFYYLTMAVINMVKYWHRYNPVFSAVKRIEMAKALVSVFTLQVAMFTQFGTGREMDYKLANGATGLVVCIVITAMAILMLADVNKDYKELKFNKS